MPQIVAAMIAGAGIVAGLRWLSRTIDAQMQEAARLLREAEERERQAAARAVPKDLGSLIYDPVAKVYRPRG